MDFQKIVRDIKELKIQGAQNVAKAACGALGKTASNSKAKTKKEFLDEISRAKSILFATRPTEPFMRNSLNYLLSGVKGDNITDIRRNFNSSLSSLLHDFEVAEDNIARIGARKIKDDMVIFTHCHSSSVMNIMKEAWVSGKRFSVHNTETRPRFQGRRTARELAETGIPTELYIDSAARIALKKADMMLMGADAITIEGVVINKIGSEMFAEIADSRNIPVYSCTHSWKFDPLTVFGYEEEIEKRRSSEIWKNPPKGVRISNYAFENVSPNIISGIISEFGIYKPGNFIEEMKKRNKWMF